VWEIEKLVAQSGKNGIEPRPTVRYWRSEKNFALFRKMLRLVFKPRRVLWNLVCAFRKDLIRGKGRGVRRREAGAGRFSHLKGVPGGV